MATNRPKLTFLRGGTYTFDVSAPLLATHPFKFTADSGATEYTTGVTLTGTQGQAGASLSITVSDSAPNNLNYYCGDHGLSKGNHIMIPDPVPIPPDSDGSFVASPFRSHLNVTAAAGTLYTGSAGTVYYMAVDEGVPAVNDSDGTFFTDSDIYVSTDSDYLYGGGHGNVFELSVKGLGWSGSYGIAYSGRNSGTNNPDNTIDRVTFASMSTATDWGDATYSGNLWQGFGGGSRVFFSGSQGNTSTAGHIETVSPTTSGNATSWGLHASGLEQISTPACVNNENIAFIMGGEISGTAKNNIQKLGLATQADCTDHADLVYSRGYLGGVNDATRAVAMGGQRSSELWKSYLGCDYIHFDAASGTTASDFGELTFARGRSASTSDATRGLYIGGYVDSRSTSEGGNVNGTSSMPEIDYITIQTPANATDFGDGTSAFYTQAVTDGTVAEVTSGSGSNGWQTRITIQTLGSAVTRSSSELSNGGPAYFSARMYAGAAAGG